MGSPWVEAPHQVKTFKLSNDKHFEEKLEDIVGLFLSPPPEHAIVLSCDEKSQIQALDRTQPGLPLKPGRCQTMTHDYKRNGTTSLFAALNIANGQVIGTCLKKQRHQEWIPFLNLINRSTPPGKQIHLICDSYATHKHAAVKAWTKRHPRFQFHFCSRCAPPFGQPPAGGLPAVGSPTSASWLNMVERFFRDLTERGLRRGVFKDVPQLIAAIGAFPAAHNANPKPFVWTASARDILEKVKRGRKKLVNMQSA